MMDLHNFCMTIGMPALGLTGVVVGLQAMGSDLLKMLGLDGIRAGLQILIGLVGLACLLDCFMCNFHTAM